MAKSRRNSASRSSQKAAGTAAKQHPGDCGISRRIDPAHPAANAEGLPQASAVLVPLSLSPAADGPAGQVQLASEAISERIAQQLRSQAMQLAAYLRGRQRELDHREAQVNARAAELESEARAARLWFREREAEFRQHREALQQQQREAEQTVERRAARKDRRHARLRELAAKLSAQRAEVRAEIRLARQQRRRAEASLRYKRQQLVAQQTAFEQQAEQLLAAVEKRRAAVEARGELLQHKAATPSPELLAREDALRRQTESLRDRERALEQAEQRLRDDQAETQRLQIQLRDARVQSEREAEAQREQLQAEKQRAMAELAAQRDSLRRRGEQLDQSEASLTALRNELERMHRETLEVRLATEELWVELSGNAPPAALTRSLGRIRSRLAEHYQAANQQLQQQRQQFEAVRRQLAGQFEQIQQQKAQFDQWTRQRREELDTQAARLMAREERLRRKEAELDEQTYGWQVERLEYQQQIRRLRARCLEPEAVGAPG